ncbi:MAG: (Fe-S)-binding protein [Thermodesulfobacteriota bacterium]
MEHQEILHRCFRCGYCKFPSNYTDINCPAYLAHRFETFSPGGRMWLLSAWLNNRIGVSQRLGRIMFSCTGCGNCVEHCAMPGFKDQILLAFTAGRDAILESGTVPGPVRDYLTRVQNAGNPYGQSGKKRADWRTGTDAADYSGQEYLFFAGDVGAYDSRGQEIARTAAALLAKAGVDFGVLTDGECSDGNDVAMAGEKALFEELAGKNIKVFIERGVKKIITLSPHSFHAFKNLYPALGGQFQVFHYTQMLAFLLGRLSFKTPVEKTRVTFHDPCFLGRHNADYQSPRTMLAFTPGIELVEMDRNRKNALCCGGGGGNLFTDMISGGDDSPARARCREAAAAGATVLAVACPACAVMLGDAVKTEGLENRLQVREVSELVVERVA